MSLTCEAGNFYAFQQVKAGRPQYLETLETQMFEALGLDQAA